MIDVCHEMKSLNFIHYCYHLIEIASQIEKSHEISAYYDEIIKYSDRLPSSIRESYLREALYNLNVNFSDHYWADEVKSKISSSILSKALPKSRYDIATINRRSKESLNTMHARIFNELSSEISWDIPYSELVIKYCISSKDYYPLFQLLDCSIACYFRNKGLWNKDLDYDIFLALSKLANEYYIKRNKLKPLIEYRSVAEFYSTNKIADENFNEKRKDQIRVVIDIFEKDLKLNEFSIFTEIVSFLEKWKICD